MRGIRKLFLSEQKPLTCHSRGRPDSERSAGQLASRLKTLHTGSGQVRGSPIIDGRPRHVFFGFFYPESKCGSKHLQGSGDRVRERASVLLRFKSVKVGLQLQLQFLQFSAMGWMIVIGEEWGPKSPSGAPSRCVGAWKRQMVSEFIEKGFDLWKSRQREEKTPQDKPRPQWGMLLLFMS